MRPFWILFCLLFCESYYSQSPILPAEGSTVHTSQVYFEEAFVKGASHYELQLFNDSTASNPLQVIKKEYPAFYSQPLPWHQKYYWRVRGLNDRQEPVSVSPLHSFRIRQKINSVNTVDVRLDLTKNDSSKHNNELIMLDYARGIFNRRGEQVWAMPEIPGVLTERNQVRDLRLSPDSTITFLGGNVPVEIDFEGKVLWKAPSPYMLGKDSISYHHDFKKTKNGHYQVLGNKKVYRRIVGNYTLDDFKNEPFVVKHGDTLYRKTLHGLLMEFDQKGKLLWYWDATPYITDQDMNYKKRDDSLPSFGTHMNAFSVNEAGTKAYVGFRDLSRIVRVDLKTNKVEFSYGEKYPSGEATCPAEFRGQHDATITNRNTILVFNNNNDQDGRNDVGSVLEYKDASDCSQDPLIWKFSLKFDTLANGISPATGNVDELPNGNLLVCGGGLPRIFEVTKNKEVVWDAFVRGLTQSDTTWNFFNQYRSHWTPKLYLYHFVADVRKVSKKYIITIINTGNTSDSYEARLIKDSGKIRMTKKTSPLKPGERTEVVLNLGSASDQHIEITSVSRRAPIKKISPNK